MVRLDARRRADDHQPLDQIAQFAHVARPRIHQQHFHRGRGEFFRFLSVRVAKLLQEVRREDGNVFGPFAQRGHVEGNYVEPVKQIFAERVAADFLLELLVGRGDHAHVHRDRLIRAKRFHALLFQHAQHFRLRFQAHVADFVEEQRAAIGFLKFSDFVFAGAGEAALAVAEHFRFDQFFGNRRAVHFDKRLSSLRGCWHEARARPVPLPVPLSP